MSKQAVQEIPADGIVIFTNQKLENLLDTTKKLIKTGGDILVNKVQELLETGFEAGKVKVLKNSNLPCSYVIIASSPIYDQEGMDFIIIISSI